MLLAACVILAQGIKNPGVLIQVPSHLQLPIVPALLPFKIASGISIQKLELVDVNLRTLDYSWELANNTFNVVVPEAVISFHWYYGEDSGLGTFTETHLALKIVWEPAIDSSNRFKVEIISSKLTNDEKKSKITINLGGNVKETIAV